MMDRLLNIKDVCTVLGVAPGTIYGWISKGVDIPYFKVRGTVRFREKSLQDWIISKETARKRRNFEA
jgi:excisionase family DNA binding protein